jgi:hypothetical protein
MPLATISLPASAHAGPCDASPVHACVAYSAGPHLAPLTQPSQDLARRRSNAVASSDYDAKTPCITLPAKSRGSKNRKILPLYLVSPTQSLRISTNDEKAAASVARFWILNFQPHTMNVGRQVFCSIKTHIARAIFLKDKALQRSA